MAAPLGVGAVPAAGAITYRDGGNELCTLMTPRTFVTLMCCSGRNCPGSGRAGRLSVFLGLSDRRAFTPAVELGILERLPLWQQG